MSNIYELLLVSHAIVGGLALILFWIPVLSRKGSLNHRRFGDYYSFIMHAVAITGIVMALMVASFPFSVKPELSENQLTHTRLFAWYLVHLGLLILASVRYGKQVIQAKQQRDQLKQPLLVGLLSVLTLNSVGLFFVGVYLSITLFIIFAALGLIIGLSSLGYIFSSKQPKQSWLQEHLGAYLGSGIGAYTAFFVFGGNQFLSLPGQWQLLLWIGPGVIGGTLIAVLTRKYAKANA